MSKVKIGNKAMSILKSFSKINPEMRIREDFLYCKTVDAGLSGIFELPKGEIETEEFGVGAMNDLLSIVDLCKDFEMNIDDECLTIEDKTKKFTYLTTPLETIDERSMAGQQLFEQSDNIKISFIVDETNIQDLNAAMGKLNLDSLKIVSEDGVVKFRSSNSITENSVDLVLEGKADSDCEFEFQKGDTGSVQIFNLLFSGIYSCQVREVDYNGKSLFLIKLVNTSISGEDNGKLFYLSTLS